MYSDELVEEDEGVAVCSHNPLACMRKSNNEMSLRGLIAMSWPEYILLCLQ